MQAMLLGSWFFFGLTALLEVQLEGTEVISVMTLKTTCKLHGS